MGAGYMLKFTLTKYGQGVERLNIEWNYGEPLPDLPDNGHLESFEELPLPGYPDLTPETFTLYISGVLKRTPADIDYWCVQRYFDYLRQNNYEKGDYSHYPWVKNKRSITD